MKSIRYGLLALSTIVLVTGCDIFQSDKDTTDPINRELPRSLSAQEAQLAEGSNDFAFRLLQQLHQKEGDGSFFVSPLSISLAFGMAMNGAEGETFDQMQEFFGRPGLSREEMNHATLDLLNLLASVDSEVAMQIANSIWYRQDASVKEAFLDNNREYYDAEVSPLDFGDPESVDIINSWVDEKTNGLIDKLIPSIDPEMYMFLVNAIYFKGNWTIPFKEDRTKTDQFYLADGDSIDVPMMEYRGTLRYHEDLEWQVADLWYGRGSFSFTVMVPAPPHTFSEVIPLLTADKFEEMTGELYEEEKPLYMPRFELDYTLENFPSELQEMGLVLPFDQNQANFSGITETSRLFISEVAHKAVVKVNEEGTEAAAATSIGIQPTSAPVPIRLDQPFLFFIRENSTNTILFMGAYTGQ